MSEPTSARRDAPDEEPRGILGIAHRIRRRRLEPEDRLSALIDEHRRELEEHARRFQETLRDLERRERLLSDARASVERMLRLGTRDLDAREEEVSRLVRELGEREALLREREEELARRRAELGAVELKRLALEQRERALARREEALARAERLSPPVEERTGDVPRLVELAFVPGPRYALLELAPTAAEPGETLVVGSEEYDVARIGPSPLPEDRRLCAYLLPRSGRKSS
jgi:hypothetical protein